MTPITRMTRRRVLVAVGAAAGLPLAQALGAHRERPPLLRWTGIALGAPARITLCHPDDARARRTLADCVAEVARLERVFSLHHADSEISTLNRHGAIAAPSHDLVALLAEARRFAALSDGAFDVTVQPLWRLYARHFATPGADPRGPDPRTIDRALGLVDWRAIDLSARAVRFERPGMATTLNGIAQGAISDRVAELLRDAGFDSVLVELGEIRALGGAADGPWRIGVEDPAARGRITETVALADGALATSAGSGTRFDAAGRFHHLFDPLTGDSANGVLSATAMAPSAATADALATALVIASPTRAAALVGAFGGSEAWLTHADGSTTAVSPT